MLSYESYLICFLKFKKSLKNLEKLKREGLMKELVFFQNVIALFWIKGLNYYIISYDCKYSINSQSEQTLF